jgi:nucleotide-binding universal stress UspA family protein
LSADADEAQSTAAECFKPEFQGDCDYDIRKFVIVFGSPSALKGANLYKKVLLAYDGSIEGRRALREGAKLAQFCGAEVFLLAVVEISSGTVTLEGGFAIPVEDQIATYEAILAEGVERLKAIGFAPTARLGMGSAGQEIAGVAEEIGANLVVVGHRPTGPLARWWFGSVGAYLIKHLRCSVLVAQTEISDDQFAQLLTMPAEQA